MKWHFFLLLFLISTGIFSQSLNREDMRALFIQATEHKPALDSLLGKLEAIEKKSPTEECYQGICTGLCCQYDDGNWAKLKHVMKSKNLLNSAVDRSPKDPELRFMRFMLEHFLPSFLGLNKHISDDLAVIFSNPTFIDGNPDLKKKAIEFLLWTKRCTPEQNKLLESQMNEVNKKLNEIAAKKSG